MRFNLPCAPFVAISAQARRGWVGGRFQILPAPGCLGFSCLLLGVVPWWSAGISLDGLISECCAAGAWRRINHAVGRSILQVAMAHGLHNPKTWRLGVKFGTGSPMTWAGAILPAPASEPTAIEPPCVPCEAAAPHFSKPHQHSARLAPTAEDAADKARIHAGVKF
jgi:hypothetical protein